MAIRTKRSLEVSRSGASPDIVSQTSSGLLGISLSLMFKFAAVLVYSPVFVIPGILVAVGGALVGRIYMAAQVPVKREMSNARYVGKASVTAHCLRVTPSDLQSTRTLMHRWRDRQPSGRMEWRRSLKRRAKHVSIAIRVRHGLSTIKTGQFCSNDHILA